MANSYCGVVDGIIHLCYRKGDQVSVRKRKKGVALGSLRVIRVRV